MSGLISSSKVETDDFFPEDNPKRLGLLQITYSLPVAPPRVLTKMRTLRDLNLNGNACSSRFEEFVQR